MRIVRLRLKDFLSHQDTVVTFPGDINVIIGHNGAGKSSLIDGITFALFKKGRGNREDMIRQGASSAEVDLTLRTDRGEIRIVRGIPTRSDLLYINGKLEARSSNAVTEKLREMNLDEGVLLNTVLVRQGEIESVFEDLGEVIKRILMITNLEKLTDSNGKLRQLSKEYELKAQRAEEMDQELRKLREEMERDRQELRGLEELESSLESKTSKLRVDEAKLKNQLSSLEEKRSKFIELRSRLEGAASELRITQDRLKLTQDLERRLKELEKEIGDLQKYEEKKALLDVLQEKRRRLNDLEGVKGQLERNLTKLTSSLEIKRKLEPKYANLQRVRVRIRELEQDHQRYQSLKSLVDDIERKLAEQRRELEELPQVNLDSLQRELEELEERLTIARSSQEATENLQQELMRSLESLREAKGGKCPVCGGPLDEEHRILLITDTEKKLSESRKRIEELRREVRELEGRRGDIRRRLDRARELKARREQIEKTLSNFETELRRRTRELEDVKDKEDEYSSLRGQELELLEVERQFTKVAGVDEQEVEELEGRLGRVIQDLTLLKREVKEVEERLGGTTREQVEVNLRRLVNLRKERDNIQRQVGEREVLLRKEEELRELLTRLEEELKSLNFTEEDYTRFKGDLEALTESIRRAELELAKVRGEKAKVEERLRINGERERQLSEEMSQITKYRRAQERLERLRKILGENMMQRYLISTVRGRIENNLNDLLSLFNLSFVRVTLNFEEGKGMNSKSLLRAYGMSGQQLNVEMLSGGERIAIALGLRLAIARALMGELGFMILDEPTIHLDSQRRSELLNVIKESTNAVPQIIVVTHDEEVLRIADYVIRVEKLGDVSKVREGVNQ
ncbi:ATPase involved in DNA repair [Metallosphaera yellowstonensis MK1]|uniref:ATPase involved in DNA repair n=1 Tax=Metallosphaera yellowstonensis MK1 TaxID=671065 RepID=H2C3I3_9CREN|nr:SMC family ATPase [Metallosphaera yellowstonensis]EHP70804.1 ATPase involved in DNA repair [Metallosphaera yellowstonensis MK1]